MNSTFKYKDPRIAWIGNPHQQNCMVEAGTEIFPQKCTPKKNRNQKKLDGNRYGI